MDDFVEGSISVDKNNKLYSVWADFRNGAANCNPLGSVATATTPCDNDVFYNYSTDGGATWSAAFKLTPAGSAQWMPWSAVVPDGKTLWGRLLRSQIRQLRVRPVATTSPLPRSRIPSTNSPSVSYQRLTTSSMPNLVPANNPVQTGFRATICG